MLRRVQRPGLRSEPLVHFAAIGCLLFGAHAMCSPPRGDALIVDAARAAATEAALARKLARPPTPEESAAALLAELDDERLYREALALGLEQGDPIVRRRLIQKLQFVQEDLAAVDAPDDADLAAIRDADPDRYTTPARHAVTHVLAARDRHVDAKAAARTLQAQLQAGADPAGLGDLCVHGQRFAARTTPAYAAMFGEEFAAALADMSEGTWSLAPSQLGWHVVRVDARDPPRLPDLATLRPRLRAAWDDLHRDAGAQRAAADLRARYPTTLVDVPPALAAALAEAGR
jgi:peptidyl-prolyl cis-trans isomerase C